MKDLILTAEALAFLAELQRVFNPERKRLLQARRAKQKEIDSGVALNFLAETKGVRNDPSWKAAAAPADLQKRWVEITGPTDAKMMINALNSGADVYMADFEDANAPTWKNMLEGQAHLKAAVRKTLTYTSPEGKAYRLNRTTATLVVRPRGLHLEESNLMIDGEPIAAAFFDFGLAFFQNAQELIKQGSGPYYYLPKLESHLEARLWNQLFIFSQEFLSLPQGTIRATVLIETIPAAFEMEEILYELKEHIAGLNAGRWDYIFSIIKKFSADKSLLFPDRAQLTMDVPFMQAYTDLLVRTCHKREAHAIGGMAAFVPSRKDPEINAKALEKVREDKIRESAGGFDGTWVAHPDLVPIAHAIFEEQLKGKPAQKEQKRGPWHPAAAPLLHFDVPHGKITEAGFRQNIKVGLLYLTSWLSGTGAVALFNLMEDAATAEISRAQLWQWVHHPAAAFNGGTKIDAGLYAKIAEEEMEQISKTLPPGSLEKLKQAKQLLDQLVLKTKFEEFLTLPAYQLL